MRLFVVKRRNTENLTANLAVFSLSNKVVHAFSRLKDAKDYVTELLDPADFEIVAMESVEGPGVAKGWYLHNTTWRQRRRAFSKYE